MKHEFFHNIEIVASKEGPEMDMSLQAQRTTVQF